MSLYILHSISHLARLLYVSPETFGPYYVCLYKCLSGCYEDCEHYAVQTLVQA